MRKIMDIDKYRWYQCDIIRHNGRREYWFRFIATSQKEAEQKVESMVFAAAQGIYFVLCKRLIDDFHVYEVPEGITRAYNFLKSGETEAFYRRERG